MQQGAIWGYFLRPKGNPKTKGVGLCWGRVGKGDGESWVRCRVAGRVGRSCCRNKEAPSRTILVEVSTLNALVSQCYAVGGYDWSFQVEEEHTNYALMTYASLGSSSSSGSVNEVAPFSKACSKAYATLQSHYNQVDFRKSQYDVLSYKTCLELVEARLVVYQQNGNVFKEDIKLLKLDVMLRDNARVELRKKFEKAEKERVELKLTLEKFQTSSNNLIKLLEKLHSYESDDSVPKSPVNDRYKSGKGYHVVPPPYTGTFVPPKPNLVFNDAHNASETITNVVNVESSSNKPSKDMSQTLNPDALIIKDWTSDSEDETEIEFVPKQTKPSFVPTTKHVKTPRKYVKADCDYYEKQMVQKRVWNNSMRLNHHNSPRMTHPYSNRNVVPTAVLTWSRLVSFNAARPISTIVPQKTVKSPRPVKHVVNKNKGVIDSGFSRHMTGNISYLSDFQEFNGGYVAFGGNPKGGKISGKGKIKKGKLDFDDVYFVMEHKFNLFSVSQMCDNKNSVLFTNTECVVLSSDYKLPDENHVFLRVPRENNMCNVDLKNAWAYKFQNYEQTCKGNLVRGLPSKIFENNHTCVAFKKGKQHRAFCKSKPVNSVSHPLQRSWDLRAEFEEFSINSTNRVNAVIAPVSAARQNPTNSTNSFNTAGPSNTVGSPNFEFDGKSSFMDPSNYLDDPDMPALEDIVYSDDEEDVSAEADFFNLETNISVSPIPTTRVHKDYPVTQLIGDLTLAPQTRSMARMVKEQGGLNQINDEDFHT
nr:hypothetical protein [Tanacetum cinerariifolium]